MEEEDRGLLETRKNYGVLLSSIDNKNPPHATASLSAFDEYESLLDTIRDQAKRLGKEVRGRNRPYTKDWAELEGLIERLWKETIRNLINRNISARKRRLVQEEVQRLQAQVDELKGANSQLMKEIEDLVAAAAVRDEQERSKAAEREERERVEKQQTESELEGQVRRLQHEIQAAEADAAKAREEIQDLVKQVKVLQAINEKEEETKAIALQQHALLQQEIQGLKEEHQRKDTEATLQLQRLKAVQADAAKAREEVKHLLEAQAQAYLSPVRGSHQQIQEEEVVRSSAHKRPRRCHQSVSPSLSAPSPASAPASAPATCRITKLLAEITAILKTAPFPPHRPAVHLAIQASSSDIDWPDGGGSPPPSPDAIAGWGRSIVSNPECFLEPAYLLAVLKAAVAPQGSSFPLDVYSSIYVPARESFDQAFNRLAPDFQVAAIHATGSDALWNAAETAAIHCAHQRATTRRDDVGVPFRILIGDMCLGGGRGGFTFKFAGQFDLTDPIRRMAKQPDFVTVMDTSTFVTGDGTTFFGPPPQSKDTPTDTTTARWITNIREKLTTDKTIGALVLEPFAIPTGGRWMPIWLYHLLRNLCHELKICFIVDEVASALRTGRPFAFQHYTDAILPDVVVFGKAIGVSGFAISKTSRTKFFPYHENVTSAGSTSDLLRATQILNYIRDNKLLDLTHSKKIHNHNVRIFQNVGGWGTGLVWFMGREDHTRGKIYTKIFGKQLVHRRIFLPIEGELRSPFNPLL